VTHAAITEGVESNLPKFLDCINAIGADDIPQTHDSVAFDPRDWAQLLFAPVGHSTVAVERLSRSVGRR
jgi:hypothetical protein